jgi:hypothetical protein
MEIFSASLLLKKKAFKNQLNEFFRQVFDSSYRDYCNDYNRLLKILSEMKQVEEDLEPEQLKNWTPVRLYLNPKHQSVAWLNLDQTAFTDRTSIATIYRSWQNQNKPQPILTKLEVLTDLRKINSGLKPKGFLFNTAKCGSTLLSKMLSSLPRNLVISENSTIAVAASASYFMTGSNRFSESFRIELLRSAVSALGQPRLGVEENYIIRFDITDIINLPFIKKVFPEVPVIFLYRDPVEVIVSNLIQAYDYMKDIKMNTSLVRKMLNSSAVELTQISPEKYQLVKQILDFSATDLGNMSAEEFDAISLGIFFEMAVQYFDEKSMAINYNRLLSKSCLHEILDFFQISVSDSEIDTMSKQLNFYSKDDSRKQVYTDDRAEKQKIASKKIRTLVNQWAIEPYQKLENISNLDTNKLSDLADNKI